MKSFMCEHSAEFILVPTLSRVLSKHYSRVIPIFFWAQREGNNLSRMCDTGQPISILAMYARRPKIPHPGSSVIEVKFNSTVCRRANYLKQSGIPVLAGVACASSLLNFDINTPCAWFSIEKDSDEDSYVSIDIKSQRLVSPIPRPIIKGPLTETEITQIAFSASRTNWSQAIDTIKSIKTEGNVHSYFFMNLSVYKPVYFLLVS